MAQSYGGPPPPLPGAGETSRKAIWALVCGILTPFCCITGPVAIVLGILALREIGDGAARKTGRGLAIAGIALAVGLMVVGVGIDAAILLPALARGREAARRAECENNLKALFAIAQDYAKDAEGKLFPPLSPTPDIWMFDPASVFPRYLATTELLTCPSDAEEDKEGPWDTADSVDDRSYCYLGYAIMNDEEMAAFLEIYNERTQAGLGFEEDLPAPPGKGSFGGDVFLRLGENAERVAREKGVELGTIAVMWDQAADAGGILLFNHIPGGSNVVYLDGHVDFVRYSGKQGTWPMTREMLTTMGELAGY